MKIHSKKYIMAAFILFLVLPVLFFAAGVQKKAAATGQDTVKSDENLVWDFHKFDGVMKESGRKVSMNAKDFEEIQKRKVKAMITISNYLNRQFGQVDPLVMAAFQEVPREYFVYQYERQQDMPNAVYERNPQPWLVGWGSPISDYLGQAYMTQILAPKKGEVALEIGTCSGYQASVLSRIVKEVYTIEINKPLGEKVLNIFTPMGYTNVKARVGDGFFGWPEVKDGFDLIIVTCAAQYVPPALLEQLKNGGRMIVPIGQPFKRGQYFYIYTKDSDGKIHTKKDIGCFFVPMRGKIFETPEQK